MTVTELNSAIRDSAGRCLAARIGTFDIERLRESLEAVESFTRGKPPSNSHKGAWRGLALVTNLGRLDSAQSSRPADGEPAATDALAAAPYLRDVLGTVPGRVVFARLMTLAPGGHVFAHVDPWHSLRTGLVRMQLGIAVGTGTGLLLDGRDIRVRDGELWYTDVSRTHSVTNRSARARVNALIDVEITDDFVRAMGAHLLAERVFVGAREQLSQVELRRFECTIVVPEKVRGLVGGGGRAAIRVEDSAPRICFAGGERVLLRAESRDVLNIVGTPPGLGIVYRRDGDSNLSVSLHLRGSGYGSGLAPGSALSLLGVGHADE
jgi:hypothetical protein